jgi:hypothetical protein
MAEEMQGIMALPEGMPQEAGGQIDPSQFSPVIESYAKNNPREFSKDILGGIAEADPALADQFIRELATMNLSQEVIDALQLMVDNILAAPQDYAEDRKGLIAEGVPEDLLPEQFDPAFFAAFNLALDQLESQQAPMAPAVPEYAGGGIINAKAISKELSKMGRGGDTMLAHINPQEARMLRENGGSGTINPDTGLREFGFFKKVFKGIGKVVKGAVKGLGKIVKKIAQSPLGKIALTMAAVYFMGPAGFNLAGGMGMTGAMASAVNTFAGSTLVNLVSGQKLGDALKGGIVAGAMAGVTTGVMKSFGPATPAPVTEGSFTPVAPQGIETLPSIPTPDVTTYDISQGVQGAQGLQGIQGVPMDGTAMPTAQAPMPAPVAPVQATAATQPTFTTPANIDNAYMDQLAKNAATPPATPGVIDSLKAGNLSDAASAAWKNISPTAIQEQGTAVAQKAGMDAISALPAGTPNAVVSSVYEKAYSAAMPGILSTYGPVAAVGLGAAYLGGAFKPIPAEEPANMDQFKTTGADLLAQDPSKYGLSFGGVNTTYGPNPYARQNNPYQTAAAPAPVTLAKGGIASLKEFPRKTGPIDGPGTGTSDSVPAMLSDGEFVFTAKAVRAMGQGSRRKGAKRMYALMKQLEAKGK